MGINIVEKIDDKVKVRHMLVSVSDKSGLETLVSRLFEINPDIRIFSTGGTFGKIRDILGEQSRDRLVPVSEYTGQPETQGGLVKTLDFKIYLGLLTETYNDFHKSDLERTGSVPIDMVVVNLYPFQQTVSRSDVSVESARGNIDIGGPCMIRAAAKNFIRVASVVDPADYDSVLEQMEQTEGCTTLDLRFRLAGKAFNHTAEYDRAIADFLNDRSFADVKGCYRM